MQKKIILLMLCFVMFIPKSYAKSSPADIAPIAASIIFFSVATLIAIKAIKNKPATEKPNPEEDHRSIHGGERPVLFDPAPILSPASP